MSEAAYNRELAEYMADYYADPLGYVMFNWPWGVPGTRLEFHDGPDDWNKELLDDLGKEVRKRRFNGRDSVPPIRASVVSGHGIGKTATTSWLTKFILDTRPFSRGVITATKSEQLAGRTFPEIKKWNEMSLSAHLWRVNASSGHLGIHHVQYPKTWFASGETARKEKAEGFAGLHAADSTPFYIFDEASGIPQEIYEVAQGGLTDGEPWWLLFGNPTVNSGFFHASQEGDKRDMFMRYQVDSRDTTFANQEYLEELGNTYGFDSNYFRVRVKGMFPTASDAQFIDTAEVEAAMVRRIKPEHNATKVMAVDVARYGNDSSVIAFRQGRHIRPLKVRKKQSTLETGAWVLAEAKKFNPLSINIDCDGIGGAVYDYLEAAGVDNLFAVHGAPRSVGDMADITHNRRTANWWHLREQLPLLDLPADDDLKADLTNPEYGYNPMSQAMILEAKDDMKKRGLSSPDRGDAVVMLFARPLAEMYRSETYIPEGVY